MSRTSLVVLLMSGMVSMAVDVSAHEATALSLDPALTAGRGKISETALTKSNIEPAQVEVVAVRDGTDLLLYVDDYASNAPVTGAQVDLHQAGRSLRAALTVDGLYRFPADLFDAAAPLTVTVRNAGVERSNPLELPVEAPSIASTSDTQSRRLITTIAVIALALIGTLWGVGMLHRRRRTDPLTS